MGILEYGVKLVDGMSGPARAASASVAQLGSTLGKAKTDLASYTAQLNKAKALGDVEGYRKYTALVDEHRRKVFDLTGALEGMKPASEGASSGLEGLASEMGALAGPAMAAAGAIVALGAAFLDLTYEGAKLAIEQVELRDELLTTFSALSGGPAAGAATLGMLDDLAGQLPQTRAQLADWTKTYQALGMTDLSVLQGQLRATASAQAIMGASGAEAYTNITRKIQTAVETHSGLKIAAKGLASLASTGANVADVAGKMGISAKDLSDQLKKGTVNAEAFGNALQAALVEKGVGPLENLAGDMGTIVAKAKENFGRLFDGIDTKPFMGALGQMMHILDASQPSAKALKAGLTGFFNTVFALGAKAIPIITHFFLRLELGALRTYNAAKPAITELKKLFGSGDGSNLDAYLLSLAHAAETIAVSMARALNVAVRLLSVANKMTGGMIGGGLTSGLGGEKGKAQKGGEALGDAVKGGLQKSLDMHSPSRVMMRLGGHAVEGLHGGLRAGAVGTARAGASLGVGLAAGAALGARAGIGVGAAAGGGIGARIRDRASAEGGRIASPTFRASAGAGPAASGAAGGGKQITVNVGGIHLSGADGQSAQELTETAVATLFERIAMQQGL